MLQIPCVTTAQRGQYKCKVFNLYHEVWSEGAIVTIGEEDTQGICIYNLTNSAPFASYTFVGPISNTDASWVEVDSRSPGKL